MPCRFICKAPARPLQVLRVDEKSNITKTAYQQGKRIIQPDAEYHVGHLSIIWAANEIFHFSVTCKGGLAGPLQVPLQVHDLGSQKKMLRDLDKNRTERTGVALRIA